MKDPSHFTRRLYRSSSPSGCLRSALLGLAMLLAFVIHSPELTADRLAKPMPLDGKSFQSKLGPVGQPPDVEDLLVFEDGHFVSEECERRCGYARVEYWVRFQDGGVQMRADVPCTDSDAVMHWRGTIRGDVIEGYFTWVNKRWYWTFAKKFRFKGQLVKADGP